MSVFKEIPIKGCREVQFSNGGQFFAAANANTVSVFNFYTGENTQNLRAHSQRIKSLYVWSCALSFHLVLLPFALGLFYLLMFLSLLLLLLF